MEANTTKMRPFFICLLAIVPFTFAARVDDLKKCVGGISLTVPSQTPQFNSLLALSFVSNFQTPLAIAQAASEAQVVKLVKCARKTAIRVCPRSGGHSLIGHSLCKGLVIDLNKMRSVSVSGTIATIQPGAVMGEVLWNLHAKGRWMAAGVCPSVGFAGYVLGGGHGPYEGTLSIACDEMAGLRMVDRNGRVMTAAKSKNKDLFWAMCGGGGGQFGIVTQFKWRTAKRDIYDRSVFFRFTWPVERGGELIDKWQRYGEEKGKVWFRIEVYSAKQDPGVIGYGACYDVSGVDECMKRLNKAPFFNVPGRWTNTISKARNALDLHAFFGPEGGWGRRRAGDVRKGLLGQRGLDGGAANNGLYQSTFLKKSSKLNRKFWQKYVNFCRSIGGAQSIPWIVCEMNLFNNAIDKGRNNAFPHRKANLITHYIIGGGNSKDKKGAYNWMRRHLKKGTLGVYVNYPELLLKKQYRKSYWGKSLKRLAKIKRKYDPKMFFMNPQPIRK